MKMKVMLLALVLAFSCSAFAQSASPDEQAPAQKKGLLSKIFG